MSVEEAVAALEAQFPNPKHEAKMDTGLRMLLAACLPHVPWQVRACGLHGRCRGQLGRLWGAWGLVGWCCWVKGLWG